MVVGVRRTHPRNPAPSLRCTLRLFHTPTVTESERLRNLQQEERAHNVTTLLSGHSEACTKGSWTAGDLVSIITSEVITTSNKHSHELHMWEFPARAARNAEPQTLKDHTTVMCTSIAASLRLQLTVFPTS